MSAENRRWLCFDIEMQWAERSGCSDAQRIVWKAEKERKRNKLVAALTGELPETLDGKRFVLKGFDSNLVKMIEQRILACGGKVQTDFKKADYVAIYGTGFKNDAKNLTDVLAALEPGTQLISDRTLWHALRDVILTEE